MKDGKLLEKRVSFDNGIAVDLVEGDSDQPRLTSQPSQPSSDSEEFKERFEEFRRQLEKSPERDKDASAKAETILQRIREKNDGKVIHSQFYNRLTVLNEKISLYKQVFYSRSPRFSRQSHL